MTFDLRRFAAVLALALGAFLTVVSAQDAPALRYPALVSDIAAPAIDRGFRSYDLPRDPNTEGTQLVAGEPFLRGSIIVKFRDGTGAAAQRAMLASVNGAATNALSYSDFNIVAIDPTADPEAMAKKLDAQPDVDYAQARYLVHPLFVPNDPLYARQWNYPAIDMERAWDINPG